MLSYTHKDRRDSIDLKRSVSDFIEAGRPGSNRPILRRPLTATSAGCGVWYIVSCLKC